MGIYNESESEDYLANSQALNIIPEGALPYQQSLYICNFIEEAYNDVMKDIGIHELAVFESTGSEIIYEAEEKQKFSEKITEFFKKIWSAIQNLFTKAMQWIKDRVHNFQLAMKDLKNKIVMKDKVTGKITKFASEKLTDEVIDAIPTDAKLGKVADYDKFVGSGSKLYSSFKKYCSTGTAAVINYHYDPQNDDNEQDSGKTAVKDATGYDVSTVAEFTKKFNSELSQSEAAVTKDKLKSIKKEISDYASNTSAFTKDITKPYQDSRAAINNAIKAARKGSGSAPITSQGIQGLKDYALVLSSIVGTFINTFKKKYIEYSVVAMNAARIGNRAIAKQKKETSSTNESAIINQEDLVNRAFDW